MPAFALAAAGLLDGREATTHWRYADLLRRRFPAVRVTPDVLYVDADDVLTGAGSAAGARHVPASRPQGPRRPGLGRAMAWALAHLAEPITVARMSREACLAPRTFIRRFGRRTGTSPLRWVVRQRILASLPLLEDGTAPIGEVGAAVGFESPATFRHHFVRGDEDVPVRLPAHLPRRSVTAESRTPVDHRRPESPAAPSGNRPGDGVRIRSRIDGVAEAADRNGRPMRLQRVGRGFRSSLRAGGRRPRVRARGEVRATTRCGQRGGGIGNRTCP